MGLSRNKVAVSEGAAGSPPFYGESEFDQRRLRTDSYSDIVPAERAGRWIKGQRGNLREASTGKASAERSCCSIVSDLRQKSHGSLKQWKQPYMGV